MLSSRRRVSAMLTRTREPSQSDHVAAVCGEPSLRSVAMTAGFGLRSIASASGGSGGFGIALSFLVPVAFEPEEGLLDGSRVAVVRSPFAFVGDEVLLGGGDELVLRHPVAHALGPARERLARARDVLGDFLRALDDAEVDQRETG